MASVKIEKAADAAPYFLLAAVAVLLALSAYQLQHWDTDIFWALKSGELIAGNMKVPVTDPFSYTFAGKEWVDFTWGFQVTAHLFFKYMGGWHGLFVLQYAFTGAALLFVFLTSYKLAPERLWLAALLVTLAYVSSHSRFFIRPHLIEYLFISLYIYLLTVNERQGSNWPLYLILPLQVIWINLHSSAILGLFIIGAYAAGEAFDEARRSGFKPGLRFSSHVNWLFLLCVVAPVASLINPYGLKLVIFPFLHQGGENAEALRYIGEWTKTPLGELFFYFSPFPLEHFAFVIIAFGTLASLLLNRKNVKARDVIIFITAVVMASRHSRWEALLGYFCVPVIAGNLSGFLKGKRASALKWASLLFSAGLVGVVFYSFFGVAWRDNAGIGIKSGVYPEGTISFMKKERLSGNIFNEYVYGGYLIYNYPEVKVFIDGRTPTVYSPYFFWTARLEDDAAMWQRIVSEYGINMALIRITGNSCNRLIKDSAWSAVSFDDVSILFLKKEPRFNDAIKKWGFKELNPCGDAAKYKAPKDDVRKLYLVRKELERALTLENGLLDARFSRSHKFLGLVNAELAGHEAKSNRADKSRRHEQYLLEAVSEFNKSLSVKKDPATYYDLGLTLSKLKRHDEAFDSFKRAVKLNKKHADAYLGAGLLYYDLKDYANAVGWLKDYVDLSGDASDRLAYKSLGMAYFKSAKYDDAVIYLKRAAFTTEDKKELGSIYYHLGNAFFETGEYGEGSVYYKRAIEADKDYIVVLKNLALQLSAVGKKEDAGLIMKLLTNS
ncbi:tetratricopeptide repeat protein [bacterium]|nr:MAG: tetratricopeptide repeat protein [bacterium]